jgi:hypothetical protein
LFVEMIGGADIVEIDDLYKQVRAAPGFAEFEKAVKQAVAASRRKSK